jgi:hypothetical protein
MQKQNCYLKRWDVFISYSSDDSDSIARPLADGLRRHGLSVWFDEFELRVGDSLAQSINQGLANSSYGVVILSPSFLVKKWTQKELSALVSVDDMERRRILPVWHNIGASELKKAMPLLADIVAVQTTIGIPRVVRELLRAINLPIIGQSITGLWTGTTGRLRLFEVDDTFQGDYDWNGHEWAGHIEGSMELPSGLDAPSLPILKFDWWWDLSPEKGNGFFAAMGAPNNSYGTVFAKSYGPEPEFSLLGGTWAFDYENLDLTRTARALMQNRPHSWTFRRGVERVATDEAALQRYMSIALRGDEESKR